MRSQCRSAALFSALTACAVLAGCSGPQDTSRHGEPPERNATSNAPAGRDGAGVPSKSHLARRIELTPAEIRYGIAPRRGGSVTYQPDVVIVGGGAESIRGLSPDGLTWTLDASAAHASELQPGKIMFVTNRAVGRVLSVQREGPSIAVMIGPVDLTELVRDCDIHFEQSVDFNESIAYALPRMPGAVTPVEPLAPPTRKPALYQPDADTGTLLSVADTELTVDDFIVQPQVGTTGLGVRLRHWKNGLKLDALVMLRLGQPRAYFDLKIVNSKIIRALVLLEGAAGLKLEFESGRETGGTNVNARIELPFDLSIPVLGPELPFALTLRQTFIVKTAFGAKGYLTARGDYEIRGAIKAGYENGTLKVDGPTTFAARENTLQSVAGASLGPTGLVLTHQARVIIGIGGWGFAVGPYAALNSSLAVYRHSDADTLARCRGAQFTVAKVGGVGYSVPQPIVSAINVILRALNIKPMQASGGLISSAPVVIYEKLGVGPDSPACTEDSADTPSRATAS